MCPGDTSSSFVITPVHPNFSKARRFQAVYECKHTRSFLDEQPGHRSDELMREDEVLNAVEGYHADGEPLSELNRLVRI